MTTELRINIQQRYAQDVENNLEVICEIPFSVFENS